ncbi:MAG: cytochrome c-type biogenesis protein [Hyphomicrobiales bacterium]
MRKLLFGLLLLLSCHAAFAVQPDEMLKDPQLEARARAISAGLRCLVCQNQSIDESDASVARDLRILIREQLQQGKNDDDVVGFVVDRYGDYVLLRPRFTPETWILWLTPPAILLVAGWCSWRRRATPAALSPS